MNPLDDFETRFAGPAQTPFSHRPKEEAPKVYNKLWKPRDLSIEKSILKMTRNLFETIFLMSEKNGAPYINQYSYAEIQHSNSEQIYRPKLSLTSSALQGTRESMEDAHFLKEQLGLGILAGVFDGHGGSGVAQFASLKMQEIFFPRLIQFNRNVHQTFEHCIYEIHQEVMDRKDLFRDLVGSTAVVTYIDPLGAVYIATVGDSEANFYPLEQDSVIPLSPTRNWSYYKDAKQAALYYKVPEIEEAYIRAKDPKDLRLGPLNLSRAIGDRGLMRTETIPGMTPKPKITFLPLFGKGTLILSCDGLNDYMPQVEIVALIKEKPENIAQELANYAINYFNSKDNVSIIAIRFD